MFNAWLPESSGGDTLAPMPSATDLSLRAGDDARQRAICQSTYLCATIPTASSRSVFSPLHGTAFLRLKSKSPIAVPVTQIHLKRTALQNSSTKD